MVVFIPRRSLAEWHSGTYTGHYEPVKELADLLDEYETRTGHSVPIHVDAASGGFIAPFATPKHVWDFKIPRVVSINTSGHKFGLSYVGVGWVVWRSQAYLPKDLIFELHYLGSVEYSFSLNFSRPAHPIIAQYFNFIHLGFEGYRAVALDDLKNARLLSRALEKSGLFEVLSDIHRPVEGIAKGTNFDEEDIEVSPQESLSSVVDQLIFSRIMSQACPLCLSDFPTNFRKLTQTSNKSGFKLSFEPVVGLYLPTNWLRTLKTSKSCVWWFERMCPQS